MAILLIMGVPGVSHCTQVNLFISEYFISHLKNVKFLWYSMLYGLTEESCSKSWGHKRR